MSFGVYMPDGTWLEKLGWFATRAEAEVFSGVFGTTVRPKPHSLTPAQQWDDDVDERRLADCDHDLYRRADERRDNLRHLAQAWKKLAKRGRRDDRCPAYRDHHVVFQC